MVLQIPPDREAQIAAIRALLARWDVPNKPGDLVPPQWMIDRVGGANYEVIGEALVRMFVLDCGLTPDMHVLDVGCGCGRAAVPLTRYLSSQGSYEGFDVIPDLVHWCQEHITSRFPAFRFQLADVYNGEYTPDRPARASDYVFPYADGLFDFAFLVSVFTHMMPRDIESYLGEVARVLKPGGIVYASYFLMNEQSERAMREGRTTINFSEVGDGYQAVADVSAEYAVAYDEGWVQGVYTQHALTIRETQYGKWSGSGDPLGAQDVIIAVKQ